MKIHLIFLLAIVLLLVSTGTRVTSLKEEFENSFLSSPTCLKNSLIYSPSKASTSPPPKASTSLENSPTYPQPKAPTSPENSPIYPLPKAPAYPPTVSPPGSCRARCRILCDAGLFKSNRICCYDCCDSKCGHPRPLAPTLPTTKQWCEGLKCLPF